MLLIRSISYGPITSRNARGTWSYIAAASSVFPGWFTYEDDESIIFLLHFAFSTFSIIDLFTAVPFRRNCCLLPAENLSEYIGGSSSLSSENLAMRSMRKGILCPCLADKDAYLSSLKFWLKNPLYFLGWLAVTSWGRLKVAPVSRKGVLTSLKVPWVGGPLLDALRESNTRFLFSTSSIGVGVLIKARQDWDVADRYILINILGTGHKLSIFILIAAMN